VSAAPRVWIAQPHEAEEAARLLAEFRTWYGRDWPSDNAFLATVERLIERPDTEYVLGAVDDAPPAGVAQVRYRPSIWTASDDCWLEDLYVSEAARGSGLGRALGEAVLDRARERGCRRVELDVDVGNAPARALYAALGFRDKSDGGSLFMQRALE
jgi:GNAT superfamily N-acetyltransferase